MSDSLGNIGSVGIGVTVNNSDAKTKLQETGRYVDNYLKKLQQQADNIGKSTRELQLMALAQRGATQEQLRAADSALRTVEAYRAQQREARKAADEQARAAANTQRAQAAAQALSRGTLNANQKQQLGFQLNDLFVQLSSGANPLTALIQQGSQLNGTFGGFKGTLQAIASLFTVTRVAIGGIVGVLGTLGLAFYQATERAQAFSDAMIKSGDFAGQTRGQFDQLARTVAASSGQTVGSVRDIATALIATGQIGPESFAKATAAAAAYAAQTGATAEKVGAAFAEMAEDPAKFARALDKAANLLSAPQLRLIDEAQQAGDKAKALSVIYDALVERGDKLKNNLNGLSAALRDAKNWFSQFWDAMQGGAGPQTVDDKIADITKRIQAARSREALRGTGLGINAFEQGDNPSTSVAALEAQRAKLLADQAEEQRAAADKAENARIQRAGKDANTLIQNYLNRAKSVEQYRAKLKELEQSFKDAEAAGTPFTNAQKNTARAELKKEFTPAGKSDRSAIEEQKARLALQIEDIRNASEAQVKASSRAETLLEAQRSAGLVDERAYYEEKRALIDAETQARVDGLTKERAALEAQKFTGKDKLENDRKIADVTAKIGEAQADAALKAKVLAIQQKTAQDQVTQSFIQARQAAQEYFDILNRSQEREIASVGLGDVDRRRLSGRQQIEDRYSQQRIDLENQRQLLEALGKFNSDEKQKYQDRLAVINEFQTKSLDSFEDYYRRLREHEQDAGNGINRAFQNYIDNARNAAANAEEAFTNSFHAIEDAILQFATTGKASLGKLLESLTAELFLRPAAKQVTADLAEAVRGYFPTAKGGAAASAASPAQATASLGTASSASALALRTLQSAAASAAAALNSIGTRSGVPATVPSQENTGGELTTGDFARFDRGQTQTNDSGEQSVMSLFSDAQQQSKDFGDTNQAASVAVKKLAEAAAQGGGALSILPAIIQAIQAAAASSSAGSGSGGGGWLAALASAFGSGSSGGSTGMPDDVPTRGGRAIGGPVSSGGLYRVNENGPELLQVAGKSYLMTGDQSGTVSPMREGVGAAPTVVQVNVTPPPNASRETAAQWGTMAGRHIRNSLRRNG